MKTKRGSFLTHDLIAKTGGSLPPPEPNPTITIKVPVITVVVIIITVIIIISMVVTLCLRPNSLHFSYNDQKCASAHSGNRVENQDVAFLHLKYGNAIGNYVQI